MPILPCSGYQILDTASSAGRPAVPLAKVLPHVQFISTDLAPSSADLAFKHAQAEKVTNVSAQTADAQDLQAFADDTFAAVTCTYGLLFMPDFPKALQEAYRVLQPGGLYVATLWGEPEHCQMIQVVPTLHEPRSMNINTMSCQRGLTSRCGLALYGGTLQSAPAQCMQSLLTLGSSCFCTKQFCSVATLGQLRVLSLSRINGLRYVARVTARQ